MRDTVDASNLHRPLLVENDAPGEKSVAFGTAVTWGRNDWWGKNDLLSRDKEINRCEMSTMMMMMMTVQT